MFLMHAQSMEDIRPRSNDERRGEWAAKYFGHGYHNRPAKPRIRVAVPKPLTTSEPALTPTEDL